MAKDLALLPKFESLEGEELRNNCASYADFLNLINIAEAQQDRIWLSWVDRAAVKMFPKDMELVARWMLHESIVGNQTVVRNLRAVILSVPAKDRSGLTFYDALVRSDFLLGNTDEGNLRLSDMMDLYPDHDASHARVAQLYGLMAVGQIDQAVEIVRALPEHNNIYLTRAVMEVLCRAGFNSEVVDLVNSTGGLQAREDMDEAYLYLSALEQLGRLAECVAEGSTYLAQHPQAPKVIHMLRQVAIRLDRLAETMPLLTYCAETMMDRAEGIELRALIALDVDDYDLARTTIGKLPDQNNENTRRLWLSLAVTDPSTPRRQAHKAYEAYRALNVVHAGPEMQYCSYLLNAARSQKDLAKALALVERQVDRSLGNAYFYRLYCSLLIACNRHDDAKRVFEALPQATKDQRHCAEIGLYFRQLGGDHAGVIDAWRTHAKSGGYRVFSSETVPAEPAKSPMPDVTGKVVVFAVVFNGIDYVERFVSHYRALGVTSFVIVDNASTDGTRAFLLDQPDVLLYDHAGSFRASAHGVMWINPLIQLHAQGKWALFVDIDEHLVFPSSDTGRDLNDLVGYAEATGARCFGSFMLDLFATAGSATEGFGGHRYFDKTYVTFDTVVPPYRSIQGGVRGRLTGRQFLITKSPLVQVDPDVIFLENNHLHTHLPVCDISTALLHYKFVGDATARFQEAVDRGEHFLGGRFYRDMLARFNGAGIRRGLWSRKYRGSDQLRRMGLIKTSPQWDAWSKDNK